MRDYDIYCSPTEDVDLSREEFEGTDMRGSGLGTWCSISDMQNESPNHLDSWQRLSTFTVALSGSFVTNLSEISLNQEKRMMISCSSQNILAQREEALMFLLEKPSELFSIEGVTSPENQLISPFTFDRAIPLSQSLILLPEGESRLTQFPLEYNEFLIHSFNPKRDSSAQLGDLSSRVIFILNILLQKKVVCPNYLGLHDHLLSYPSLAEILPALCEKVRKEFYDYGDIQIAVELYSDPEFEDKHVIIYVRQKEYMENFMERVDKVYLDCTPLLAYTQAWVNITTDFSSPV